MSQEKEVCGWCGSPLDDDGYCTSDDCGEYPADERSDVDQENPTEFSESYDWSNWDFDNDPDWR